MERKVFINLPVKGLDASKAFYQALGFSVNPQFTNDQAAAIVISEHIYVMLLTEGFFKTFTSKEIADSTRTTEVLNCLSAESKAEVDSLMKKASSAGGIITRPTEDQGFMYSGAFQDPDGHIWELAWMDFSAMQPDHVSDATATPEAALN